MTPPVLDAAPYHRVVQAVGALVGLGCLAVAGLALGGASWAGAALGALGVASGRLGAVVHAVATVALVGGAVAVGQEWLVPLLVVGVVATVEAGAVRDRHTVVRTRTRTRTRAGRAVAATASAGGLSAGLITLGNAGVGPSVPAMLVAAGASVALLAALRT